jgi:hypothetical protein
MTEPAFPPTPPAATAVEVARRERPRPKGHPVLARSLTVVGVLLVVISLLANFVKREALDSSHFRSTSRALVADPTIRNQLATTLVDQLYANVNVSDELSKRLPANLRGLAAPIAGAAREGSNRAAQSLLERPRVQDVFVQAATRADRELVAVLDGNTKVLSTTGGKVVLDVRPLVLDLGQRFGFLSDLQDRIPPTAARITILRSDQLSTAQDATKGLRIVADWVWVLALAAWTGAVWLARGRRRIEVRAIAVGIVIAGFLVVVGRALIGRYLVDHLVVSDSVRPAAARAYDIITRVLVGAGWTAVLVGVVGLLGVWLAGPGRRARAARAALAPYLRRPELAYGGLLLAYLLLLWWRPTPQFAFVLDVVVFFVLAVVGLEALRRLADREFPHAEPGDPMAAARGAVASIRARWTGPSGRDTTSELERLAKLHSDGALDDAEFAAAKARLLGGPS